MIQTKVARYGNSLTVRLPAAIARDMNIHEGDAVTLERVEGGLLLELTALEGLKARLATVKATEREIDVGPLRGNEVVD